MQSTKKSDFGPRVRGAGVLLPVASLPGPYGIGTMGEHARCFLNFLRVAGQRYWQVLPVGPTEWGNSPYQSPAAFAGNPYLIDLDELCKEGLLKEGEANSVSWGEQSDRIDYEIIKKHRLALLRSAYRRHEANVPKEYEGFCHNHVFWLEDYALYMALQNHFHGKSWQEWEEGARFRDSVALKQYQTVLREEIGFWKFVQFCFFRQWQALKGYANALGIYIIGDIPLYVSGNSVDCWAHRGLFLMDTEGNPTHVGGVPPDKFSKEGQNWNVPVYDWPQHRRDGFGWWQARMAQAAEWYNLIRIDHFIGLSHYFGIPGLDAPAALGQWYPGPGEALLNAITQSVPAERLIAEDLGIRNPETDKLLADFRIPSMKVLQFAFDSGPKNPHLPHNYGKNCVVYGGTHDNEPLSAFYEDNPETRAYAARYLGIPRGLDLVWPTIRLGMASTADRAVFQLQDYLGLGKEARMNTPGTVGPHNWTWRLTEDLLTPALAKKIFEMTRLYGR